MTALVPPPVPPGPVPPGPVPPGAVPPVVPPVLPGGAASPGPSPTAGDGVRGDGTTLGSRSVRRWRTSRTVLAVLGVVALVALTLALLTPAQSAVRFAPDNPGPDGGMALAEVLRDQGVDVVGVSTVTDALRAAGPGTTLLVANDPGMSPETARSLLGTGAEVVLVAPGPALLAEATPQLVHAARSPDPAPAEAACTDPDAVAAGVLTSSGASVRASEDATDAVVCFTDGSGAGHYGVAPLATDPGLTVRVLDDATALTNSRIVQGGNAALGLRMLGTSSTLVWLVPERPTIADDGGDQGGVAALLPPWAVPVGLQLLVVVVAAAVWRGRRLGPLVTESLPVVVQASETTTGRGRLYRRARARGHAGAALRAGAADRMAARLGLPRSASPEAVVAAISRASGQPPEHVTDLLYGPPPAGDVDLTRLATELDELESEVHRA